MNYPSKNVRLILKLSTVLYVLSENNTYVLSLLFI